MAPYAIAIQKLLNICYDYSIAADLNFYALKCFCVAFTLKFFKLLFSKSYVNTDSILYTDSFKYLVISFTRSHKNDNNENIQIYTNENVIMHYPLNL